ncbi:MAG: hypothetical protein WC538_10575 [Thermoanaerobaculia bacterium]|jgi:hypothetical protein
MVPALAIVIMLAAAPVAEAGCIESWDGPTACFDFFGSYPLRRLGAERDVSEQLVTEILGQPLSRLSRLEPSHDYPGLDDEVIVTLKFNGVSVTLSRLVTEERFQITRYEQDELALSDRGCAIRSGSSREEVMKLLGCDEMSAEANVYTWHHQWCEDGLAYEEWATVTLRFRADRLAGVVWDYWGD